MSLEFILVAILLIIILCILIIMEFDFDKSEEWKLFEATMDPSISGERK